ncbi:MAG TPA: CARDB domain-containing protein [Thermoanaerobaculia bacterium]|jgi:uncharacterized repeat protein (TIGR01451 family)|nr:CARDB domain-containing protein [Thermoanaerobaculia bacterium]
MALAASLAGAPLLADGDAQAVFVADHDHVSILELTGNYDRNLSNGDLNIDPRAAVAREFFRTHPDDYDFVIVFTGFSFNLQDPQGGGGEVKAFYTGVRNGVQGIGIPQFDNGSAFGSAAKLQGYVDMAALSSYTTNPLAPDFEQTLLIMAHEVLHQWAAHVRFRQADGALSSALLGESASHWSFLLDTSASVLYGNQWRDNGDGTFTSTGRLKFFSPLDLYLAGFLAPEEVPPFRLIDSPGTDPARLPETGVTVSGQARTVRIEDVIAAEGPRVPAAGAAPHDLRAAFIYLLRPGQTAAAEDLAAIEGVRRAFETRFSVLTGGRGVLRIYPAGQSDGAPGDPVPIDPGTPGAGSVDVTRALAWLRGRQTAAGAGDPKGYWEDTSATRSRDTTEALAALTAFDASFPATDRDRAVQWLAARLTANTDEIARIAPALVSGAGTASADLRAKLRAVQNADGGWGLAAGYGSDPLDTALAVLALSGASDTPAAALDQASAYLVARQGADGGWSNVAGGASRGSVTAAVLRALKAAGKQDAVAERALTWLATKQNPDGGFGDSPSTAHDTADVLQAVIELGAAARIRAGGAVSYLSAGQTAEGSWEGSAYTTGRVLSALRRSGFPNWRFTGAAQVSPAQPKDGERVTITVTVANDGNLATPTGVLRLYEGDPGAGGTASGPDVAVPPLAPGRGVTLALDWDSLDRPGPRTLVAVIDPDQTVAELSEQDNRLAVTVNVQPAPAGVDLAVSAAGITISPAQPATLPVELGITAVVRNLGHAAAGPVTVRLWKGPATTGVRIADVVVNLPDRSSAAANFVYTLTAAGTTLFTVQVDPDNQIAEADEGNNQAAATVSTVSQADLAVTAADLQIAGPAYLGNDATFQVALHNRGTVDAPSVRVRFSIVDSGGGTVIELPDSGTVALSAGATLNRTVVWRVDRSGSLRLRVELDPDNQVDEADETNNTAELAFTAGAVDVPNLAVAHTDLTFTPNPAREGKPLTIAAVVRNTGGQPVPAGAEVGFYDGDPRQGGHLIATVQTLPELAPGAAATVSVTWDRYPDSASRVIHVVADPANHIAELREDDNDAFETVTVLSLPDAEISPASLLLTPAVPAPGQAVTLTVTVANLGQQEIAGLVVRAFDGDPAQGAPQLAADQTIALLAGDSTAQVTFAATLGAGAGARPLVVVLDPDGAVDEASKANNTARLDVAPHDGDFYVTERYFSPNGDGVKDTTRFFFRAPAGVVPAAVEAVDARGRVVRRYAGGDLAAASFEWDGRDDRGVMAADGDYRLRLVDAQGKEIGAAVTTLDTDHWPLFRAFGTPFAAYTNLTCDAINPAYFTWSDDESWLFFELSPATPGYPAGIYRVTGNGGDASQILPDALDGPIVSPDGNQVAIRRDGAHFGEPAALWLANADGSDLRQIADSAGSALFAAGGQSLLVVTDGGFALQRVLLDGSATTLLSDPDGGLAVESVSPSRRRLVLAQGEDLVLLNVDSGATAIIGQHFPGDDDTQRLAWTADSSRLALVEEATGRVLVFDGGDGHQIGAWTVPVTEMADVPEYAALDVPPAGTGATLSSLGTPAWSPDGTELALKALYNEASTNFGRILRLDVSDAGDAGGGAFSTIAWLAPQSVNNTAGLRGKALDPETGLLPFSFATGDIVLWARDERSLLYNSAEAAWVIDLDDGNSLRAVPDGSFATARLNYARFGPTGRRLLFDSNRDAANPQSPCHGRGASDLFAFQSLLNLTADLRPRRSATEGGILLEGSASDLNFARYTLEYASTAAPGDWRPIGAPSETPVIDGRFATWVPPGPGSYFVRLSVEDLAGNTRQSVQQVSFADTPSISALTIAPAYISPNGDGVQDEAVIQYRVLAPVHLEFQVFNEAGEKVRTIQRDHGTVGIDVSVSWDGRDDAGLPVADGFYRITVQSYELFVTVDRTPPQVALSLSSARACAHNVVVAESVASFSVDEANPDLKESLETGPGANPVVWSPLLIQLLRAPGVGSTRRNGSLLLSLDQVVDNSFRLVARDLAGNRTVVNAQQVPEELILTGFGTHRIGTDGQPVPLSPFACVNASFSVEKGLARLAMSETVRTDLAQLLIETQAIPILNGQLRPDLLGDQAWTAAPVTAYFPAQPVGAGVPPTQMEFLWDMNDVRAGVVTAVRVRGVDFQGRQFLSQTFTLATDGVDFRGVLSKDDLANPTLSKLVAEAGLDPDRDLILWGSESIADPIARITLLASSGQDPRYAIPRSLPAVAASGGYFIFNPTDWVSCTGYKGLVIVETAATAGGPGRTLRSSEGLLALPCLSLDLQWQPVSVGECNSARQSTRRTVVLTPQSKDGRQLQLLTLSGPDENGHDGVLFSITRPESGKSYEVTFDLTRIPEGIYALTARLTNVDGQEVSLHGSMGPHLVVDNTPPVLAITYPLQGQKVCGVAGQDGHSTIQVQARVTDAGGFAALFTAQPGDGSEAPLQITGGNGCLLIEGGGVAVVRTFCDPKAPLLQTALTTTGAQGLTGTVADFTGDVTLRLRAVDNGGFYRCTESTFTFDGTVEGIRVAADLPVFSPNGDGFLDTVSLSYQAAEPTTVDVEALPADKGSIFDPCPVTGAAVRHLESGLSLAAGGSSRWDGKGDDGAVVGDGMYRLAVTFTDGCGNRAVAYACVQVDTTPPTVSLAYPRPGDPLPLVVEVQGSVSDAHPDTFTVDFGAGSEPATWGQIGSGTGEHLQEVLAAWNTYGLSGDFTLRLHARDKVGNEAQTLVPLSLTASTALITDLQAVPRLFSPDGDGKRETTAVRFGLGVDARVDLTIVDTAGHALRSLLTNEPLATGAVVRAWDGALDGGAPAPDGVYRVQLVARQASNLLVTERQEVTVVLDRTPPRIAMTRPAGGFVPASGAITGSIEDANPASYTVSLTDSPDAPVWTVIDSGTLSRTAYTFGSLQGLKEGAWALRVEATDQGEIHSEQVIPFTIDNTAPRVTLTNPAPGTAALVLGAARGALDVRGGVAEDHLDSWRIEVGAGAAPQSWTQLAQGTTVPTAPILFSWTPSGLADGAYTLRLVAVDKAGLTGEARALVTIDNTAPVARLTAPADGGYVTAPMAVTGTASDAHPLDYRLAAAPAGSALFTEIGGGSASVEAGALAQWSSLPPDGAYTLRLKVVDAAGNEAQAVAAVTVDTQPPAAVQGLTAILAGRDVQLAWHANSESDLAGYAVYRDGVRLSAQLLTQAAYVDHGLAEGTYSYTVRAFDRAGQAGPASAPAVAAVDVTAPEALIQKPVAGSRVSGLVDVRGTAHSGNDFKEYRVYASAGPGWQLLRSSPLPVVSDLLAQWSTLGLPEGAAFTLRLEAEDVHGNVATQQVTVTVDNQPAAAPTGLAVTLNGADAAVHWNANAEPDLRGYLLYRNGRLANATGAVIGDLIPYLLTTPAYTDAALPDGSFTWEVYAVDQAGNLSAPSAPVTLSVDTHAPHAVMAKPADGARVEGNVYLLATLADTDVARVQFQVKAAAAATWTNAGGAINAAPWETVWDPSALPYGQYQIRAVATDRAGQTDPDPAAITISHTDLTRPPAVSSLTARVDGGTVHLSWTAVTAADLAGYQIDRAGTDGVPSRITPSALSATAYDDSGLADGTYVYTVKAVDQTGNESDPSPAKTAVVYTPQLDQPYTPTVEKSIDLTGTGGTGAAGATVSGSVGGAGNGLLPAATADAQGHFTVHGVALGAGDNTLTVRLRDAADNLSKPAAVTVLSGDPPARPTGLAASSTGTPPPPYAVSLSWNANAEPGLAGYRPFRDGTPLLAETAASGSDVTGVEASSASDSAPAAVDGDLGSAWWPDSTGNQWLIVHLAERRFLSGAGFEWNEAPADFDLEGWDGRLWVPLARVRANSVTENLLTFARPYLTDRVRLVILQSDDGTANASSLFELTLSHLPLVTGTSAADTVADGRYAYTLTAVDGHGFESAPSAAAPLAVGDLTPPDPVTLSGSADGADAVLTWSASPSPDVQRYDVYRDGARIAAVPLADGLSYRDARRPNGVYRYSVRPVDAAGNAGEPSNEVQIAVAVELPAAPAALSVTAVPTGGALDIAWQAWQPGAGTAPAGYRLVRGATAGGPYETVTTLTATTLRDTGLTNGKQYFYVVFALDAFGNASAPSAEASGVPADTLPPAVPVLHFPARTGEHRTAQSPVVPVMGTTEPGAAVTLSQNGVTVGSRTALAADQVDAVAGLSDIPAAPLLSPDGRYLWLNVNGAGSLYDFATGSRKPVDVTTVPHWTADGTALVYGEQGVIRAYTASDGSVRDLAAVDGAEVVIPSPDGSRFAVLAQPSSGGGGLWLLNPATGDLHLLRDNLGTFNNSSIRWSPDGSRLAFVATSPSQQVAVVDLASFAEQDVDTAYTDVDWSPDSREILLTVAADGAAQVARYRLADGRTTQVTQGPLAHLNGRWSPDGRSIASMTGDRNLVVQPVSGGEERLLPLSQDLIAFDWVQGGYLMTAGSAVPQRLAPAGLFVFDAVTLTAGDNTFTAVARDAAGNASAVSTPAVVTLGTAALPDLAIAAADLALSPAALVSGGSARITVTVRNAGAVATPASDLALVVVRPDGPPLSLADSIAVGALPVGGSFTVTRDVTLSGATGRYTLAAAVDPLDRLHEASESNNRAELPFVIVGTAAPALFVATDHSSYAGGADVTASLEVVNAGPVFSGRIETSIEDGDGFLVADLPVTTVTGLEVGQRTAQSLTWSSGTVFAGSYQVHARLLDSQGTLVMEARSPFTITAAIAVTAEIASDHATYTPGATVRLAATVSQRAGNAPLSGAETHIQVLDAAGTVRGDWVRPLGDLLPGTQGTVAVDWSSTGAAVGSYRAHLDVRMAGATGTILTSAETLFDLTAQTVQVTGGINLADRSVAWGSPLVLGTSVSNAGTAALSQVPVRLLVLDAASGTALAEDDTAVDLAPGQRVDRTVSFDTRTLGLGNRLAVLRADLPAAGGGVQTVTLGVVSLTVLDRTPPVLSIGTPGAGSFLRAGQEVAVSAHDDLSAIGRVEVRLDGGAWLALVLRDAASGRYGTVLTGLSEGPHTLDARATDVWNNTAQAGPVAFEVDLTAPQIQVSGVVDGGTYTAPVTPVIAVSDAYPGSQSISLNGRPFVSGSEVGDAGTYDLAVAADDLAGNHSEAHIHFTIAAGGEPVLAVVKTAVLTNDADHDGSPSPGDTLTYTITVRNTGSAPATGVTVSDPMPAYTSLVAGSATVTAGTVQTTESGIVATVGDLAPAATATLSFQAQIDTTVPAGVRTVSNQATVTSAELPAVLSDDPAAGGSADPTVTAITASPRLIAEMTAALAVDADGDGQPSPGDTLAYTITIRNAGNTSATSVVLRDPVPASTSLVTGSVTATVGTVDGEAPPQVTLGELAAGATATITLRVKIDTTVPAGMRTIGNQGTVTSAELPALLTDDPAAGGTADPTVTAITALPRLVAEKTAALAVDADGDGQPSPGDTLAYTITVRNAGNTSATSVVLRDPVPAHTSLVAGSVATTVGTVDGENPPQATLGELAAGATATITLRVKIDAAVPAGVRTLSNQATVTSAELPAVLTDDPAAGGNADPTVTAITAVPRLAAEKAAVLLTDADGDGVASPGDTLLYQITLTNQGNTAATGVVLTDAVPAGTAFVAGSLQTSQGTATGGSPLTVSLGELAAGASASVSFRVTIDATLPSHLTAFSNQATVTSAELPAILSDDPATPAAGDATLTPVFVTPRISIADVRVTEGDTGTANVLFPVTLSSAATSPVSVLYATGDDTAKAPGDYLATSGTLVFAPGETVKSIPVPIVGDLILEPDEETFTVTLSSPVGAVLNRAKATGTIVDNEDCPGPNLLVNPGAELAPTGSAPLPGWSQIQGTSWQRKTSSPPPAEGAAYFWAGKVQFAELAQDVNVSAYASRIQAGGQRFEFKGSLRSLNESPADTARFVVEYRDAANQVVLDAFDTGDVASPQGWQQVVDRRPAPAGTGWIRVRLLSTRFTAGSDGSNDGYFDALSLRSLRAPVLTVGDATVYEGDAGTTNAPFAITLACPLDHDVAFLEATANGTATAGSDYVATQGTVTFPAGSTAHTVNVPVLGDRVNEPNETFLLNVTDPVTPPQAVLVDPQGLGVILNDDACPRGAGYWKTHTSAWPASTLVLGGVGYDSKTLLGFLSYGGSDASMHLVRQLVATKFDLLMGSSPSILPVVGAADAFLVRFPPGSKPTGADMDQAENLKDQLENYNEGQICGDN